jgi:hypothetical protein
MGGYSSFFWVSAYAACLRHRLRGDLKGIILSRRPLAKQHTVTFFDVERQSVEGSSIWPKRAHDPVREPVDAPFYLEVLLAITSGECQNTRTSFALQSIPAP